MKMASEPSESMIKKELFNCISMVNNSSNFQNQNQVNQVNGKKSVEMIIQKSKRRLLNSE